MTEENIRQTKTYNGLKTWRAKTYGWRNHMADENIWRTKTYDGRKHKTDENI